MQPERTSTERALAVIAIVLLLSMLVVGAMLARRNVRLGRGDRRGAFRLAALIFGAGAVAWLFGAHHVASVEEFALFYGFLSSTLLASLFFWILYIALEPYVRRRWPATLVSWSRLLAGGFRDPLVGRDVLVGCLWGALVEDVFRLTAVIPFWLGSPPPPPVGSVAWQFLGARMIIAGASYHLVRSILYAFVFLFVIFLFRVFLRKQWAVVLTFGLFISGVGLLGLAAPASSVRLSACWLLWLRSPSKIVSC